MDRLMTTVLTLLAMLSLWMGPSPAHGKCMGEWASHHACRGANGKRSGPPADLRGLRNSNSVLFERLLRANVPPPSEQLGYDSDVRNDDENKAMFEDGATSYDEKYLAKLENLLELIHRLRNKPKREK